MSPVSRNARIAAASSSVWRVKAHPFTTRLAEAWLAHPDEWCEDCMHGEGTLAGDVYRPVVRGAV